MSTPSSFKGTGGFDATNQKVTNLADATTPQDALNLRTFDAKNTVQTYDPARSYPIDYIIEYVGQLWKCIAVTTGAFDKTKWSAIRGTENWIRITGAYTAIAMDSLVIDTTATPLSITLPGSPKSGDYITIVDAGNADINNITVIRNGATIAGQAANLVLNESAIQVTLVYLGGTWILNIERQKRVKFVSGTATVESNVVYALVIGSSFTVTLPVAPKAGDWVSLIDRNGTAGTYPITVDCGVKQIDGASTFLFNQKKAAYQFIYNGTGWVSFMLSGNSLLADKNLSDVVDKPTARSNLGLGTAATVTMGTGAAQIRTNTQNDTVYQPLDQTLTAFAALVTAADKLAYSTGVDTFAQIDFPASARSFLAATTQALQRTALGLGTAATATVGTAAGNVMAVGAFGLGGDAISGGVDVNTYITSGMYVTPSSGVLNIPAGWDIGRNIVLVSGSLPYVTQVIIQTPTNVASGSKMAFRYGTAADTWSVWYELGVSTGLGTASTRNVGTGPTNLIEVQNSFGLGSAVSTYVGNIDAVATIPRGWVGVDSASGTTGTLPYATGILQTVGSVVAGNIRQVFHQITGLSSTSNKTYVRDIYNSTVGPWKNIAYVEDLGSAASRAVGTANTNVMEVGAFGLGGASTSYAGNLNSLTVTQFTYVTTAATNTPVSGVDGVLTHIQASAGFASQEFIATSGVGYRRYLISSSWGAWFTSCTDLTGEIVVSSTNTALPGTIKANGSAVSRTVYAKLFAKIGTTFGVGDGSTTFNLPDLRGEVIRGWDDGRGIDTGRAFGSLQLDQMQGHRHSGSVSLGGSINLGTAASYMQISNTGDPVTDGTNGTPRFGSETRARNVALLFCIRY